MPPQPPQVVKATLTALPNGKAVPVCFNPTSLVYSVENSVAQQSGSSPKKAQYVAQFSAKLSMDLQFDTTDTGSNVLDLTNQVALFMQASGNASAKAQNSAQPSSGSNPPGPPPKAPPVLLFQWGVFQFQGLMDSFKETIDFFSAEGVPLRSLVSIGLSRQDVVFDDGGPSLGAQIGSMIRSALNDSVLSLATRGGDQNATRKLAKDNGLDSLRFTNGAPMQVGSGVQLNPPAAFVTAPSASASAGFGFGASAGVSAGLSFGVSGGASAGISGGASAGFSVGVSGSSSAQQSGIAPAFGGSASAGVSAAAGAFAGLQTGRATTSTTTNLDPLMMMPSTSGSDLASFNGASFSLGGAANNTGSAGLSSNVGAKFDFNDRLLFSSDD